tara:strand:- start:892 stop:1482 length:591 start_codon:yes stop_codon:yes gene_type:complete
MLYFNLNINSFKLNKMAYIKQNDLLLNKLLEYYNNNNNINMDKMLSIINGNSRISLRIVDWFATNYAKKHYTIIDRGETNRFKVYNDYKLNLKAYSKKRFDPFCRWQRITVPYKNDQFIQTTIGQLNFFKWAIQNDVVKYIEDNYSEIESDMNNRNSSSKKKNVYNAKTRKKREELSISASKSIKKEEIEIVVEFN